MLLARYCLSLCELILPCGYFSFTVFTSALQAYQHLTISIQRPILSIPATELFASQVSVIWLTVIVAFSDHLI